MGEVLINTFMEKLEKYKKLLKKHDFYWRQSDDHRFLDENIREEKEIDKLAKKVDSNYELYNQFSPYKK